MYAYLEKLQYLDYHIIKHENRVQALDKYREEIDERDNQKDAEKGPITTPSVISKDRMKKLKEAHILCANNIFKKSLEEDEIIQKFTILPKYTDFVHNTEDDVREKIDQFTEKMLIHHKRKMKTIDYCTKILREGERDAEKKSILLVDEFKAKYNEEHKKVKWKDPDDKELDNFEKVIHEEVDILEDKLMVVEMKLVEALTAATGEFSKEVEAINNEMTSESTKFTNDVQEDMNKFIAELRDHAYKLNEDMSREDENNLQRWDNEPDLIQLLYDKETLTQYFEQAKENQENKISEKDNIIRSDINNDWKNTKEKIIEEQHDRNRNIIQEIIRMTKERKQQVSKLVSDHRSD